MAGSSPRGGGFSQTRAHGGRSVRDDGFYPLGSLRPDEMVEEMSPEDLQARIENGDDVQVIDVRPERDFRRGHVPGAENVPITRFARAVDEHEWADEIVVVCPVGESSLQAARLLEAYEGVSDDARVANLTGGYAEWEFELEES